MEGLAQGNASSARMSSRWSTRAFAVGCLRLVISVCARQAEAAGGLVGPTSSQPLAFTLAIHAKSKDCPSQLTDSTANASAAHFDLEKARNLSRLQSSTTLAVTGRNWLVLHLADLIRMAFGAASSESQQLRAAGLNLMRDVISRFGHVPDPDCPGDRLLGQYRAQVSAALRPAFSAASSPIHDANSPELTAIAYYACSAWISSGVARTPEDLRRFEKLLHQAFDRLLAHHPNHQQAFSHLADGDQSGEAGGGGADRTQVGPPVPSSSTSSSLGYCDEAVTVQVLAFLRACADIYLVSVRQSTATGRQLGRVASLTGDDDGLDEVDSQGGPWHWARSPTADRDEEERETSRLLTGLLSPLMPSLVRGWLTGLQDHALLGLPDELASQRPISHGFVTPEMMLLPVDRSTRQHYLRHWPVFLLTLSTWLQAQAGRVGRQQEAEDGDGEDTQALKVLPGGQQNFYLLLGLCLEAFSDTTVKPPLSTIVICLKSLNCLLSKPACRSLIFPPKLPEQPYELVRLLHRLVFTGDSVEVPQLCLQALQLILTGAEEHLCRLRASWLSKESQCSQSESHLISTTATAGSPSKSASTPPLPTSTSSGSSMVTSLCLPSTSLVDAEVYELAEGGLLSGGEEKNEDHVSSGAGLSVGGGLQPSRSLVLSALELIVSLLARYRPAVIADMRQWRAFAPSQPVCIQPLVSNTTFVPEVHCTSNVNIGGLLATALHCVELLPNLCAPQLLLSSLNISNSRRRLPDDKATATPTSDGNLLPVLLQLAVSIAQDVLLDPISLQKHRHASLLSDGLSTKPPDQLDQLPDLRSWLDSQACSQSTDSQEPEISSTGIGRGGAHQLEASFSRLASLNRLIGWSAQQAEVAQAVVGLLSRLASHHYPTLTMTSRVSSGSHQVVSRCPPSDPIGLLQPDSSSGSYCNGNGNVMDGQTGQPLDVAASQWYELVGSALIAMLHCRYLHRNSSDKISADCPADDDACCLASFVLVCRTVASCPVCVLKTHNLHAQLIDHSCRYWRQGVCPGAGEQASSATDARPVERRICLSAIRLLAGHTEPAVRCSFIKALSPQIFYWLYEVSQRHAKASSEASPTVTVDQHQLLLCIHDAISLLEYLIDCSEANGRQGLMLIILPMLCSLLCTSSSTDTRWQQQHQPFSADSPSTPLSAGIHTSALRHTVSIASRFPTEFRIIVSALGGDLRGRLETAIKCSAAINRAALGKRTGNPTHGQRTDGRAVIQLRTDFSSFGS